MIRIMARDNRKSYLSEASIIKYKGQITKIRNISVLSNSTLSTFDIIDIGLDAMKKDNFKLIKEQINI